MYQFIHIETYAREASKKVKPSKPKNAKQAAVSAGGGVGPKGMDAYVGTIKTPKTRSNVSEVLGEAARLQGHFSHVSEPLSPTWLVGNFGDLLCLDLEIERKCAREKERTGRAPRKDTHVLLAGVASYPSELAAADPKGYEKWEKATLQWLREKYGDNLRAVLRHDDEAHPHIHFFAMDRQCLNAKALHDGYAAAAGFPSLSKESTKAYNDAMRDFQSDYYEKVGHDAGLLRDGPKRKRLDRPTYKAQQREARERVALDAASNEARADLLDSVAIEAKTAAELRRTADREVAALAFEQVELDQLRASVQRDRATVDVEWNRARARIVDLDTREKVLSESETDLAGREMLFAVKAARIEELKKASVDREQNSKRMLERAEGTVREADRLAQVFRDARPHLATVEDIGRFLQRPELQGMLEFVATSQDAQDLLRVMKTDPVMVDVLRNAVMVIDGLGDGQNVDWTEGLTTDWGAVQAATEQAQKPKDAGLDFSM